MTTLERAAQLVRENEPASDLPRCPRCRGEVDHDEDVTLIDRASRSWHWKCAAEQLARTFEDAS